MFDGDPQARAKDRDRDRAVYVIEAALRNGQISQPDRDLRVQRARSAATLGDLEGLVRDLETLPVSPGTGGTVGTAATATAGTVAAATVVAAGMAGGAGGALTPAPPGPAPSAPLPNPYAADPQATGSPRPADDVPADLYGSPWTDLTTKHTTLTSSTPKSKRFRWVAIAAFIFFIAPGLFGGLIAAFQSGGGTSFTETDPQPVPDGPPFVLDGPGLRAFLSAFDDNFDDSRVVRAVFYDGYVVSWVPESSGKVSLWNYRNSAFERLGDPMDASSADAAPVDLHDLKPAKVMKLVQAALDTLNVPEPATTYVIYDRNIFDNSPEISIYRSGDNGADGFLQGDLKGHVVSSTPNGG